VKASILITPSFHVAQKLMFGRCVSCSPATGYFIIQGKQKGNIPAENCKTSGSCQLIMLSLTSTKLKLHHTSLQKRLRVNLGTGNMIHLTASLRETKGKVTLCICRDKYINQELKTIP